MKPTRTLYPFTARILIWLTIGVFPLSGFSAGWQSLLDAQLSRWEVFMGVPHSSVTGLPVGTPSSDKPGEGTPLGLGNDPKRVFSVIEEAGQPVLKITGEIYGGLTTLKEYGDFHFSAQVRWGDKKWPPRLDQKRDSGFLYHCTGAHGAFWKVWMRCAEFQVQEEDFGDLFMLAGTGGNVTVRPLPVTNSWDPKGIFDPTFPSTGTGRVKRSENFEKPHGEWNTIEVYALGRQAVHLVNGHVVLAIDKIRVTGNEPLTRGKFQIQSEGAEVYYRDIKVRPITELPSEVAKASGLSAVAARASGKPKVWIYSDMSDKTLKGNEREGSVNDPDDISAMAGYLLMANEFETLGIVVASTHRSQHRTTPNQGDWANSYHGGAYRADVANLNRHIGGYPADLKFVQSCIKKSAEKFDPAKSYPSLENYSTVQALLDVARAETNAIINVLCWGSLTEPAILVKHCLHLGDDVTLKKLRFIAHWTNSSLHQGSAEHPENVANCREDAAACAYLKEMAFAGKITYFECGAIGQHGIVSGSPKGREYFDAFKASQLGTIFIEGKYVHNSVDHSDAATYWTLLGKWGVSLQDIASDGTNDPQVEKKNEASFTAWSKRIHDELLRRSNAAAGKTEATQAGGK